MSTLIKRILELGKSIEEFPLEECSYSTDLEEQSFYVQHFRNLAIQFSFSLKRIKDKELQNLISNIDFYPQYLSDAFDLKSELVGIIHLIEDLKENAPTVQINDIRISPQNAGLLMDEISSCLVSESANNLNTICEGYGLKEGTVHEAFKSKANYVYSRIAPLSAQELYELAKKMQGKYPSKNLDELLLDIDSNNGNKIISEFEKIKELIQNEINTAKYSIWVAVAWFTDKDLANLLYIKYRQGLSIQIILNNDEINAKLLPNLKKYFTVLEAPKSDRFSKLMHHKFCIIDLKKVLHGSYNWTVKAQYNNETITLIEERDTAQRFAHEFVQLKKELLKIKHKKSSA